MPVPVTYTLIARIDLLEAVRRLRPRGALDLHRSRLGREHQLAGRVALLERSVGVGRTLPRGLPSRSPA